MMWWTPSGELVSGVPKDCTKRQPLPVLAPIPMFIQVTSDSPDTQGRSLMAWKLTGQGLHYAKGKETGKETPIQGLWPLESLPRSAPEMPFPLFILWNSVQPQINANTPLCCCLEGPSKSQAPLISHFGLVYAFLSSWYYELWCPL